MNSTTLTLAPSASYTVAISRPMMPPPMMRSRLGTSARSSAPVESMRRGSSYGKPGMRADCEPAAMMQWSNETVFFPSLPCTSRVCGDANRAVPSTTVTLRALARPASPLVSLATTPSFQARSLARSVLGLPNSTPNAPISSASAITRAACSSALDGMQPTLRHTPPSVG